MLYRDDSRLWRDGIRIICRILIILLISDNPNDPDSIVESGSLGFKRIE